MPEQIPRLAGVFALALAGLFGVRHLLVPETFGDIGHYRARAVAAKSDTSDVPVQVSFMARTAEAFGKLDEAIAYQSQMDALRYTAQVQAGPDADWLLLVRAYAQRAAVCESLALREQVMEHYCKVPGTVGRSRSGASGRAGSGSASVGGIGASRPGGRSRWLTGWPWRSIDPQTEYSVASPHCEGGYTSP